MDLNEALVFVRVVEAGSFTAAGQRLDMPKSTVSRRVSQLEERLGARLLQRTTRKLRLTEDGEAYFSRAASAVAALEDAERAVLDASQAPRGVLRITAPVDLAGALGTLLTQFSRAYPEVTVVSEFSQRKVDLVGEGIDVALRAGNLDDSSLVARKIVSTRPSLYASEAYLARAGVPKCLTELAEHECILFGSNPHTVWHLVGPRGKEEIAVEGRLVSNDFAFCMAAAEQGAGITFAPVIPAPTSTLVRVLPEYSGARGGLYAVYPSSHHLTPKVRCFVDFIADHAARGLGNTWD